MSYQPTAWKDHIVEYPNRYTITPNGDGTSTVTRSEGTIIQQGTPITATNLQKIETELAGVSKFTEDNQGSIKNLTKNQMALALEWRTWKNAALIGVDAGIWIETFDTTADITLSHGAFDAGAEKIYLP